MSGKFAIARPSWAGFDAAVGAAGFGRLKWDGLIFLMFLGGCISVLWGQDAGFDLLNYHLYTAHAWWTGRRVQDIAAAQFQTYFNPLLDMPYYWLTRALPDRPGVIAFVMGLPAGIVAFLLLRLSLTLCRAIGLPDRAAAAAWVLGVSGVALIAQVGNTSNDVQVTVFVLLALDRIAAADRWPNPFPHYVIAGLCGGLAVGAKLTAIPFSIGLAAGVLAGAGRPLAALAALAIGGALGGAISGGYWTALLWRDYGNPLFPFFNHIFRSPLIAPVNHVDPTMDPKSWIEWVFYPGVWALGSDRFTHTPMADVRFALALLSAPILAVLTVVRPDRFQDRAGRRLWRAVLAFWIVSYVVWLVLTPVPRYAMALELLSGPLLVGLIGPWLARRGRAVALAAAAVAAVALGLVTIYPDSRHLPFGPRSVPAALPPLAPNALVVALGGGHPLSYVALLLPDNVPLVAGYNSLIQPPFDQGLAGQTAQRIARWPGPLYVLRRRLPDPSVDAALARYRLVLGGFCQPVQSAWDGNVLELCPAAFRPAG